MPLHTATASELSERVAALAEASRGMARDLDFGSLTPDDAAALVEQLGVVARVATSAMTVLGARAADSWTWRRHHREPGAWLGEQAGLGCYDGRRLLDASQRLARNPGNVRAAMGAVRSPL